MPEQHTAGADEQHTAGADERVTRRSIPQREATWAQRLATSWKRAGITPNAISVGSVVLALAGAIALVASAHADPTPRTVLLLVAAACAPLRLLFNMLDGMLAVEGGMHSPVGDLYNEVPDRVSDVLFLAGAGYAASAIPGAVSLGWAVAVLAVLTAYVRALGGSQGLDQHFAGPMSKPLRMWVLVLGCLGSLLEAPLGLPQGVVLVVALAVVGLGSLVTVVVRLRLISRDLHARAARQRAAAWTDRGRE